MINTNINMEKLPTETAQNAQLEIPPRKMMLFWCNTVQKPRHGKRHGGCPKFDYTTNNKQHQQSAFRSAYQIYQQINPQQKMGLPAPTNVSDNLCNHDGHERNGLSTSPQSGVRLQQRTRPQVTIPISHTEAPTKDN